MKRFLLGTLLGMGLLVLADAEPLKFLFHQGDQFRFYGTTIQNVTIDGQPYQKNVLLYRVSYSTAEASATDGLLRGHISFSAQPSDGEATGIDEEYDVEYRCDSLGRYTVDSEQLMPTVRSVPTLPGTELKPGDTWSARGEEVHDLRRSFGVDAPIRVPVDVSYTYRGTVLRDGQTLHVIQSDYNLYKRTGFVSSDRGFFPVLLSGYSHQTHYFNAEKGREEGYQEEYTLVLTLNNGHVITYSGSGESRLAEAQTMDKPALVEEVKKSLKDEGLGDVQVKATPQGVSLNLDNILFPGDSAQLVPSEQEKVRRIGEILRRYPDRDILVEGHTADVVSATDPQKLSQDRAAAVGNALVAAGVRTPEQITYRGWGASKPLMPNDTEEHRTKNRRVEITLLEN